MTSEIVCIPKVTPACAARVPVSVGIAGCLEAVDSVCRRYTRAIGVRVSSLTSFPAAGGAPLRRCRFLASVRPSP